MNLANRHLRGGGVNGDRLRLQPDLRRLGAFSREDVDRRRAPCEGKILYSDRAGHFDNGRRLCARGNRRGSLRQAQVAHDFVRQLEIDHALVAPVAVQEHCISDDVDGPRHAAAVCVSANPPSAAASLRPVSPRTLVALPTISQVGVRVSLSE